ncbi:MAG: DUF421 domain-containing protein [Proteobacteria bacterium]|nr:MAG: DUF421 domain-containing protein [Pseudomonadota bacterium]
MEEFLKGKPEIVILRGKICQEVLDKHQITRAQIRTAVRKEGVRKLIDVKLGVLEPDGTVSVIKQ